MSLIIKTESQIRADEIIGSGDMRPTSIMVAPVGQYSLPENTEGMSVSELWGYVVTRTREEMKSHDKAITSLVSAIFAGITDHNGTWKDSCRVYITRTNLTHEWVKVAMMYFWGDTSTHDHPLYVYGSGYAC